MREIEYHVIESLMSPDEIIYTGTLQRDKQGKGLWRTRCDVTCEVEGAFLRHCVAKAKKRNPNGKGIRYSFDDVSGYDIEIIIKKKEFLGEKQ